VTPHLHFHSMLQHCDSEAYSACVVSVVVGGHRVCQATSDCIRWQDGSVRLWSNVRWARGSWWWMLPDPFRSCIKSKT